jgi:hypothetical protein
MSLTPRTDNAMAAVIAEGGELGMHDLPLIELARQMEQESARLLVLATKHCPPWHHDWETIRDLDARARLSSTQEASWCKRKSAALFGWQNREDEMT